jgi:hypothetical protein
MSSPIEKLKATRWWEPACKKYASHLGAHRRQGCESLAEGFSNFCIDILSAPEHLRDELLNMERTPEELEAARLGSAPCRRYRQYDQPIPGELKIGTATKQKKKKKRKNVDIRAHR